MDTGERPASAVARVIERANERIERSTEMQLAYFTSHPEEIPRRLEELDREWGVERLIAAGVSGASLTGLVLGVVRSRRWLLLPLIAQGLEVARQVQGRVRPPLSLLRALKVRTDEEIAYERRELLQIQGEGNNSVRRHSTDDLTH